MVKFLKKTALAVVILALYGCVVGPDYDNPNDSIGQTELLDFQNFKYAEGMWKNAEPKDSESRGSWWTFFGDKKLDEEIELCRKNNPDLMSLFQKVEQARESAKMTESALYPQGGVLGYWEKAEVGDHSLIRPLGSQFEDWATGATLTWDADLFGRIRSMLAASRAEAQSLNLMYENALLSLQTKVAALHFSIMEFEAEKVFLQETVDVRVNETKLIKDRYKLGYASESDLQRAIEQEFTTRSKLSEINERIVLSKNMLANLLGTTPAKIEINLESLGYNLPEVPEIIPSGLLERRADIASAEREVCAANHKIGAATAAFFPTVSITSSLGTESTAFSKLLNASSFAWGVSPQIYIPIFQLGKLSAQKRVALAKHKQTLADYKSTVLKAVRETEDALAKIKYTKQREIQTQCASNAAKRTNEILREQYELGVTDYFVSSEAHRYALLTEIVAIRARGDRYRATIDLIRALGGGWKIELPKPQNGVGKAVENFESGIKL